MAAADPKPLCERIGHRIHDLRTEMGLSLVMLAKRVEMSVAGLWAIERGHNEPRAGTLLRLARVLGVNVDALLADDGADASDEYLKVQP